MPENSDDILEPKLPRWAMRAFQLYAKAQVRSNLQVANSLVKSIRAAKREECRADAALWTDIVGRMTVAMSAPDV